MTEEPAIDRFTSFGAVCAEANGHDIEDLCKACETPHEASCLLLLHARTADRRCLKAAFEISIRIGADERD